MASTSLTDDRWICPICLDILIGAVETHCCHNLFCEACLSRSGYHCPVCNCRNLQYSSNIPIRRLVDDLTIPCPNVAQGCESMVVRSRLEPHRAECGYERVSCCHAQCSKQMLRKDLRRHVRAECEYRVVGCPKGCGARLQHHELQGHFDTICPKQKMECNNGCGKVVERGRLPEHKSQECPLELVFCPHSHPSHRHLNLLDVEDDEESGPYCTSRLQRRHLPEHVEKCEFRRVHCENEGCTKEIVFKTKDQHEANCPWQLLECPHGCKGVSLLLSRSIGIPTQRNDRAR